MLNKIRKQKIGNKEYSFQMTNKTIIKADEKFGNYAIVVSGLMEGQQFYTNALRLISCCCIERDFTVDELVENFTQHQFIKEVPDLATQLYFDYIGINDDEHEENQEDNEGKN